MNSLEFSMLWAVTQNMLGWAFYPLLILAVVLTIALFTLLIKEKKIISQRLMHSEIAGIFGGFIGILVMLWLTDSSVSDISGPIDWVVFLGIFVINFVGTAILYYIAKGYFFRK